MRTIAVSRRILQQLRRDRRTVAMILFAPILILSLVWMIFDGDPYPTHVAVVNVPPPLINALKNLDVEVVVASAAEADALIRVDEVDAVLTFSGSSLMVLLEGSKPLARQSVMIALQQAVGALATVSSPITPEIAFLHGDLDLAPFDSFGPVLLGLIVFMFTFMISGISFVRERTSGTLERMMATPLRRWEVVLGYVLAFLVVMAVQVVLITSVSVFLLDMMLAGSFVWLLVITMLLAATALTLGMLLSAAARTEFQMIQFIPLVIIPQVFFSGLFPLETIDPWLRGIGTVFPLTYGAEAMREVMIRGGGWAEIWPNLAFLGALSLGFLIINIFALKKYRRL
jgi:ABC-2 type transport system permease protein